MQVYKTLMGRFTVVCHCYIWVSNKY